MLVLGGDDRLVVWMDGWTLGDFFSWDGWEYSGTLENEGL
jgi:hypothetical protein